MSKKKTVTPKYDVYVPLGTVVFSRHPRYNDNGGMKRFQRTSRANVVDKYVDVDGYERLVCSGKGRYTYEVFADDVIYQSR